MNVHWVMPTAKLGWASKTLAACAGAVTPGTNRLAAVPITTVTRRRCRRIDGETQGRPGSAPPGRAVMNLKLRESMGIGHQAYGLAVT